MSSTTATSRALRSPELCQLICDQVGINDRKTLYSLCLSSKTFLDPALDVLWYKLDNLAPLMRCMSRDLYQDAREGKVVTLVSNIMVLFFFYFNPPSIVFSKTSSGERLGKI
jgi:hypothetical protein